MKANLAVNLRWRVIVCIAVIMLGVIMLGVISTAPKPDAISLEGISMIPYYPLGLSESLGFKYHPKIWLVCYVIFAMAIMGVLCSGRKWVFYSFVSLLIIVCALTTKGCYDLAGKFPP